MSKIIAVERGMEILKMELEKLGYAVYYIDEKIPCDVFIFKSNLNNNLDSVLPNSHGSLILNGEGKSVEEIDQIIRRGLYSPLF